MKKPQFSIVISPLKKSSNSGRVILGGVAIVAAFLMAAPSLRAEYYYNSVDSPDSSIGAANSSVIGVKGSNVVGTFFNATGTYSYVFDGTNYTVLDNPNAAIPGTTAVGASSSGIAGNFTDTNGLSYGFFTPDSVTFTTIDPSGSGSTTVSGISGATIFGNYGQSGTAFFSSASNPAAFTNVLIPGSLTNSVIITGVAEGLLFGTYETGSGVFGFTTSSGDSISTITAPQGEIESILGVTTNGGIVGNYLDGTNSFGFITFNGTNLIQIQPADAAQGSVQVLGAAGQNALGSYIISSNGNPAGFLSQDGNSIIPLYGPTNSTSGWSVVGASGPYVFGNVTDSNGASSAFWTILGSSYNPIPGPLTNGTGLSVTNVFSGSFSGQYWDSLSTPHNFVCLVSGTNGLTPNYLTVDGPPTGSSITAMSLSNSLGFYVDQSGVTNCFLISGGIYFAIPSPNADSTAAATQLLGFSSSNAVGTYVDADSGYTYGFLTANGTNYTRILGPAGTNAGIANIAAISGSSIAGTYVDQDTGNTYGFLTQNGGSSYTILKGPSGYDGSSLTVAGVSGGTVVGSYNDADGILLGFQGSAKVTSPGGAGQLLSVNGMTVSSIVGTYSDPNTGNTYGFIGTGNTSIRGPYGTNGVGINTIDVISGNLIAGTYVDSNLDPNATNPGTGLQYGFLTSEGVNYTVVTGPSDSSGGIYSINYLSGSANTVIGTYYDTNDILHWFAYDGVDYTVLEVPQAQPGGSTDGTAGTTVNGMSGSTVFGTYLDLYGLTHAFQATLLLPQTIAFNPTFAGTTPGVFLLNGISSSGLPVSYKFLTGGDIANISNNTLSITNAGTVTVVASQQGNGNYKAATDVTNTITVKSQTIDPFLPINAQTYGIPFTVTPPSATSQLPVRLSVSGPATIAGNLVTPVGTGVLTLTASQPGNSTNLPATPVSTTVQIQKASQTIDFAQIPSRTFGAAPFAVTLPKASSALPVTLSLVSGPATISGNIVTVTGAGQVALAASQSGNSNYLAATTVTNYFTVNQASQVLASFAPITGQTYGTPFTVVPPSSSAGLPVTLSVLSGPATISSNVVTPTGVGLVTLAANQSGDTNYLAASQVTASVNVGKAQQVLSAFTPVPSSSEDFSSFTNGIAITPPTSSSTNNPVVVSVASGPATISNNIVRLTGNGVITLSASQAGDANNFAATPVRTSFSIGKEVQTLNGSFTVSDQTFGAAPFTVTLPTASSGLPVILSVVSGPATISGSNTVSVTGVGTVTLVATQPGDATRGPVETNATFTVRQGSNGIAFFSTIPNMTFGAKPFNVAIPAATSGLPVALSVISGPATISGNTVTVTGAGTVTLAADQPGNANYPAAAQVTTSFVVSQAPQSIGSFAPIASVTFGSAPFAVTVPSASSGLPVSLSVLPGGPATVNGNILTITGVGPVTLAASQAGSANYSAASNQTVTFTVRQAAQSIAAFAPIPAQTFGVPFTVNAPTSSSGLPVSLSVVAGPGTISGSTVIPTGVGIVTLAANQPGETNSYSAASQVLANVTINPAPQVLQPFPSIKNIVSDYTAVDPFTITPPVSSSTNPVIVSVKSGPAIINSNNVIRVTGNGVIVLSAIQPATANYLAATPITTSFSVGRKSQSLTGEFQVSDTTFPAAPSVVSIPYSVDSGTNRTGLPVTLSVISGPAMVKGTNVSVTGAGVVTLAANQAGSTTYGPAPQVTTSFTVSQGTNVIDSFTNVPANVTVGVRPFVVTAPKSSSGLPVTLSVLSGPATISGNTVTVTGAGQVTLAANQSGNANFPAAEQVTTTITVGKGSQSIAPFAPIAPKTYGAAPFVVTVPAASSGLPVTLSVVSGPASVSSNTVTVTGAGQVTLAANQPGNDSYASASQVTTTFTVTKGAQTIAPFGNLATRTFAPGLVVPITAPASSSGLPVNLSVLSGPGSIDLNNNLTVTGAGSIVLAANTATNIPASTNYTAAAQVRGTLLVNPAAQVMEPFPTIPNIVSDFDRVDPFTITPPASSSTNPVIVSVKSGPATVSSNNLVTLTGNGVIVLSATQSASSNYLAAVPVTTSFSVGKASQSLVGTFNVSGQRFGSAPIAVIPPVSVDASNNPTGLPVTLTVLSGPATIKGTNVTLTGAGVVTLAANQAGNTSYGPAPQMTTSFTVAKNTNSIGAIPVIGDKVYGSAPFRITPPGSSSRLPVSLSVLSGPATITSNTVTINGVGTVIVAANQPGDSNFDAAAPVTNSFIVFSSPQSINFARIPAKNFGDQPFSLTSTASSGLPVAYSTTDTNVISISGNVVKILRAGTASITASQSGNDNYQAASNSIQNLVVNRAAQSISVSVPSVVSYVRGGTVLLSASSTSGQPVTYTVVGGPATPGVIGGNVLTPTGKGTIRVTASVSGNENYLPASQTFTITTR